LVALRNLDWAVVSSDIEFVSPHLVVVIRDCPGSVTHRVREMGNPVALADDRTVKGDGCGVEVVEKANPFAEEHDRTAELMEAGAVVIKATLEAGTAHS
jgi:hypothetical protein